MSMNVLMRLFFWCGVVELALGMPNQTHPAARRPFLLLQQQLARALQPPPPLVLSQQLLLGYQQLQQQQQAANLAAQQLAVQVASNGDPIVNLRSAQLPLGGMDVPAVEPEALIERLTYTYMMETPLGLLEPRFTAQVWAVGGRMMFADHDYMTGTPAGRRYIPWVGVSMFANDTIGDTFHNGMNLMTVEARRWEFSNRTEFDPGDGTGSMLSSRLPLHVRSSQQGELPPTWPGFLHPPVATGDAVFCSLKTDADPERFAKVFKVYIEHTPGVSPFAALCTAVQDHPEACAWTLQYGEEHKEPEKRTLEKLMMAFTERFAPQTTSGGSWREVANRRPAPPPPPPSSQTGAGPSNAAPPQNQAPGVRFSALPKSTQATPRRFQSAVRPPRNHAQSNQPQKRKRQDLHLSNPNGATTYFANYLGRCLTHKEYHQHRRKGLCGRCGENGHIGEDCAKYQYVRTEHQDVMTE
ncbi:hypothetical protein Vafri_19096 [Volvox africanus]|uniref:CCHC-type domain-containing protein n=1 Tax=Volvox africanus TaxID=51714 RepID=A0A8J4BNQ3_9CHLO|nr:hypothetical protein Vafri_19096 [Volvox africanus]